METNTYLLRVMRAYLFQSTVLIMTLIMAMTFLCIYVSNYFSVGYNMEIWIEASENVDFFLSLIVCVVYVPNIYIQYKKNFAKYAEIRCKNKQYAKTQFVAIAILTCASVFLSYYSALLFCLNLITPGTVMPGSDLQQYVFGSYQIYHPYVFGAVWCLWKGCISVLFVIFGGFLAIYTKNLFVSVLSPFLYCMAENLVTALLQMPQYSIVTSYVLNRLSPQSMRAWYYPIGVVTFIVFTSIIVLFVRRRSENGYA